MRMVARDINNDLDDGGSPIQCHTTNDTKEAIRLRGQPLLIISPKVHVEVSGSDRVEVLGK